MDLWQQEKQKSSGALEKSVGASRTVNNPSGRIIDQQRDNNFMETDTSYIGEDSDFYGRLNASVRSGSDGTHYMGRGNLGYDDGTLHSRLDLFGNYNSDNDYYRGNLNIGANVDPFEINVDFSKTKYSDIEKQLRIDFYKEVASVNGLVLDGAIDVADGDKMKWDIGVSYKKLLNDNAHFKAKAGLNNDGSWDAFLGLGVGFNNGGRVGFYGGGGRFGDHREGMGGAGINDPGLGQGLSPGVGIGPDNNDVNNNNVNNNNVNTDNNVDDNTPGFWGGLWGDLQTDWKDFKGQINLTNAQKMLRGLAISAINPAGILNIGGLGGFLANTAVGSAATLSLTDVEKAQATTNAAKSMVDAPGSPSQMAEANTALAAAQAGLEIAQDEEAVNIAETTKQTKEDLDVATRGPDLAKNPYTSGTSGVDYSNIALNANEQTLYDELIGMNYSDNSARQFVLNYYNNPNAPEYGVI